MTDRQPPARYTVGLVQMAMSADPDANLKKAVAKVSEAAAAGARLVCLLERSEEHTSELQSQSNLVCRLLLEKKKHRQGLPHAAESASRHQLRHTRPGHAGPE